MQDTGSKANTLIGFIQTGTTNSMLARAQDFWEISKPGIGLYIGLTAYIGFALSGRFFEAGIVQHLMVFLLAFVATAGSAGVNMVLERETDAHMERTKNRPLPTGRLHPGPALAYALICLAVSLYFAWLESPLLCLFLAAGAFVYIFIYTMWLKPRSTWNISIGGLSGTFAALAGGYAYEPALTVKPDVILLALFLFFWSPAHFWNLGIYKREEYKKVGFPMLPASTSVRLGVFWILVHVLCLVAVYALFFIWGDRGPVFALMFAGPNLLFLYLAVINYRNTTDERSKKIFLYSILYLFLAYISLGLDLVANRFWLG